MNWTGQNFNCILIVCLVNTLLVIFPSPTNAVPVRLQDGSNQCEGRLEIAIGAFYGSSCDRSFGNNEAKVVCRQLGCPSETSIAVDANVFGPQTNHTRLTFGYQCSGTENTIADCNMIGTFCSILDVIGVMCAQLECPLLPNPTNGAVAQTGTLPGSQATCTCDKGFAVMGGGASTCLNDGKWCGSTPTCEARCPLLPNPINGAVAQTGIVPGSKATYTCDIGFAVVGSGGHTCQEDGKWSVSSAPICEARCPLLPNPTNGAVAQTGIVPGSKATYTCDIRFVVVGSGSRTCQEDGKWSVSAPICEARCPFLPNPTNGVVVQTGRVPGSQATYTCGGGFVVVGSGVHTCLNDGKWSGSAPTCEPNVPLWFNQTQLCYRWRPDGDGGQCGGGVPRDLCATVGSQTRYYRDDTDGRGGGCRMQWTLSSPNAESWFGQARICYRWFADGNGGQCGGGVANQLCAPVGTYTPEYRDDSDGRGGGCRMSWKLSVPSGSPQWASSVKLCYQWYPDGDGGQCGGGVSRQLCAAANTWTTYYRDDTDGRSGGCQMSWGLHI